MLNHHLAIAALTLSAAVLAGCQTGPVGEDGLASRSAVYSTDLAGKAAFCEAPPVKLVEGAATAATIVTGGGGWCGISVTRGGEPYATFELTQSAKEGKVYVHRVGDYDRIDYIPLPRARGADAFTVKFLPGDAVIQVKTEIQAAAAATRK